MEILWNLLVSIPSEFRTRMGKSVLFSWSNNNRWETEYLFNIFIIYPLFTQTHRPWPWGKIGPMNEQIERTTALLQVLGIPRVHLGRVFAVKLVKKGVRWLGKENRRVIRLFTESICFNIKEHFCSSSTFPGIGFTFSNSKCFLHWGYLKQSTVPLAEKEQVNIWCLLSSRYFTTAKHMW